MDSNHMHLVVSVTSRHFSGLESAFFSSAEDMSHAAVMDLCSQWKMKSGFL
jgi:hypothetical protein